MKQGSVNVLLAVTSLYQNHGTIIETTYGILHLHLQCLKDTLFVMLLPAVFFSKSNLQCILFLYISSGLSYPVISKPLCALHLSSALFQSQISFLHLTTPCLPPVD